MICLIFSISLLAQHSSVYSGVNRFLEARIEGMLVRMKIAMGHARSKLSSPDVSRLGISGVWMTAGLYDIHFEVLWNERNQVEWIYGFCVAFLVLTCLAATWNQNMVYLYGNSIGEKVHYRNNKILLGPGGNILRTPLNGCYFEYMGENPFLVSRIVYVKGLQLDEVVFRVKKFSPNMHGFNRYNTNVVVDDCTLCEIYLSAFKAVVLEERGWGIIRPYNLCRNQLCCHNQYLLNDFLKKEWKFDAVIVSAWRGGHNISLDITDSLNLDFDGWTDETSEGKSNAYNYCYFDNPYVRLIQEEEDTRELYGIVRRILHLILRTSMNVKAGLGSMLSPSCYEVVRKIGEGRIVVSKNEKNVLPNNLNNVHVTVVVGENVVRMLVVGVGSSSLKVQRGFSSLEGICACIVGKVDVVYARGYVGDATGGYDGVVSGQDLNDFCMSKEWIAGSVHKAKGADCVVFVEELNIGSRQDFEGANWFGLGLSYTQDIVVEALMKVDLRLVVMTIWVSNIYGMAGLGVWSVFGAKVGNVFASVFFGGVNLSGSFLSSLDNVLVHVDGEVQIN